MYSRRRYNRRANKIDHVTYKDYVQKNKNYYFEGGKAYTEDKGVIIYNIFVHKIPYKTTEEELLKFFKKFGEVNKIHWVGNKTSSKSGVPRNAFIYFKDALSAAYVLKEPSYNLQMGKIFVKACDSWHQPQTEEPFPRQSGLLTRIDTQIQLLSKNCQSTTPKLIQISNQLNVLEPQQLLNQQQQMNAENNVSTRSSMEDTCDTTQLNILQLNDDCLEIICQKLGDQMRNQICFARVCKRFRNIFRMVSKSKYKVFEVKDSLNLTLWEYRDFFKFAGQYIQKLTFSSLLGEKKRILEFAADFCTNVEILKFSQIHIRSSALHLMLMRMKNITELELKSCKLKDNATMAIKKLTKLEVLSLCGLDSITGNHLKDLKNIRELRIEHCRSITEINLIKLFESLQTLTSLSFLRNFPLHLTSRAVDEILKNFINLEALETDILITESLAFLPKLKKLELVADQNYHQLIIKLAERKAEQLEYLKIRNLTYEDAKVVSRLSRLKHLNCMCNRLLNDNYLHKFAELEELEDINISESQLISEAGLLQVLRKCFKLKSINIEDCKTITNNFVVEAIKLLKKNCPQRNASTPLLCYAFGSHISRNILKDPLYIAGQSYMKVILEYRPDTDFERFLYLL